MGIKDLFGGAIESASAALKNTKDAFLEATTANTAPVDTQAVKETLGAAAQTAKNSVRELAGALALSTGLVTGGAEAAPQAPTYTGNLGAAAHADRVSAIAEMTKHGSPVGNNRDPHHWVNAVGRGQGIQTENTASSEATP